MKNASFIALLGAALPGIAAADAATDLVNRLSGGKAAVVSTFQATEIGMTGVVMKKGAGHVIVYVEPTGKFMLSGVAIDQGGKNLSQAYNEKYIPKPDFTGMWSEAEKTAYIEYGSPRAKSVIYVVGESNCGYCKRFHRDVKPLVDKGDLAVRWIMLGFDEAADAKAAGVIAADNKKEAMDLLYEKGQTLPANAKALEKVKVNHAFADKFGIGGTPFILSKEASGKIVATPGAVAGASLEKLVAAAKR